MDKEYWNYLKEHDPIHYSEMKGDPVTGLNSEPPSCITMIIILGLICFIVFCLLSLVL